MTGRDGRLMVCQECGIVIGEAVLKMFRIILGYASMLLGFCSVVSLSQEALPRISFAHIEGRVLLDGRLVNQTTTSLPLKDNWLIATDSGQVELRLRGDDIMFLDHNSSVRLHDSPHANSNQIEILNGSVVVVTKGSPQITCEDRIYPSDTGIFRFKSFEINKDRFCDLKVYQGAASVQLVTRPTVLRSGQSMNISKLCGDMIPTRDFNITQMDSFDRRSRELLETQSH